MSSEWRSSPFCLVLLLLAVNSNKRLGLWFPLLTLAIPNSPVVSFPLPPPVSSFPSFSLFCVSCLSLPLPLTLQDHLVSFMACLHILGEMCPPDLLFVLLVLFYPFWCGHIFSVVPFFLWFLFLSFFRHVFIQGVNGRTYPLEKELKIRNETVTSQQRRSKAQKSGCLFKRLDSCVARKGWQKTQSRKGQSNNVK